MQGMVDAGVATRRGVMCTHQELAYANLRQRYNLGNSEWAQDTSIILPPYPSMTEGDIEFVSDTLRSALKKARGHS